MNSKDMLNHNRMISIFFVFVLATTSFLIHFFANIPEVGWLKIVNIILYYFGFFGYASVIGIVLVYYGSIANKWLKKNKLRQIMTLAIFLALSYSVFDALSEKSWLIFFRDIAMSGLIVIGLPYVEKFTTKVTKWKKKK